MGTIFTPADSDVVVDVEVRTDLPGLGRVLRLVVTSERTGQRADVLLSVEQAHALGRTLVFGAGVLD